MGSELPHYLINKRGYQLTFSPFSDMRRAERHARLISLAKHFLDHFRYHSRIKTTTRLVTCFLTQWPQRPPPSCHGFIPAARYSARLRSHLAW